jgi:LIVCS family branched-chain amino acid:cation transporter
MKNLIQSKSLSVGLAMFSMFFGAGNIIYPLIVGQYAGDKNFFAIIGLIITAALMPIAGVIAMILFDGDYKEFFGRLGRRPGFILAFLIIALLGPLGSTPRCIALAYTTLKSSFLPVDIITFSAISCATIFLFTVKKKYILPLLGWVLTPFLLISLIAIIIVALISGGAAPETVSSSFDAFFYGMKEGYNTMDLLAAFFFSSTIIAILKSSSQESERGKYLNTALCASCVGVSLLGLIYIGFSYMASMHGHGLTIQGNDELLSAITLRIAGPYAGVLVCIAIALACLTTAIALISAFADFIQRSVFEERVSYEWILCAALLLTFAISTLEFTAISGYLWPILQIFYPVLIVLTFLNIANRLWGIKVIKGPVYITTGLSLISYFM